MRERLLNPERRHNDPAVRLYDEEQIGAILKRLGAEAGLDPALIAEAANLANHADMRTTFIYNRRDRIVRRTQVERIIY